MTLTNLFFNMAVGISVFLFYASLYYLWII